MVEESVRASGREAKVREVSPILRRPASYPGGSRSHYRRRSEWLWHGVWLAHLESPRSCSEGSPPEIGNQPSQETFREGFCRACQDSRGAPQRARRGNRTHGAGAVAFG